METAVVPSSRFDNLKSRIAMKATVLAASAGAGSIMLMPYASAAINFTPIQELLEAVVDLIPTFLDLVVAMAPLLVTISIIGFVIKFLDRILEWLNLR